MTVGFFFTFFFFFFNYYTKVNLYHNFLRLSICCNWRDFIVAIEIRIILCANFGHVVVTHVREFERVEVCASGKTNWQCGMEDGETKRAVRRVQMYIDQDPGNRSLNKFKIILI